MAGATDTFHEHVAATGYAWNGPDRFYSIEAAAGESFTVSMDDGNRFDGGVYIARSCDDLAASAIAGADVSAGRPTMSFTVESAGTYIIVVDSYGPSSTGEYSLSVARGAPPPTPASAAPVAENTETVTQNDVAPLNAGSACEVTLLPNQDVEDVDLLNRLPDRCKRWLQCQWDIYDEMGRVNRVSRRDTEEARCLQVQMASAIRGRMLDSFCDGVVDFTRSTVESVERLGPAAAFGVPASCDLPEER